MWDRDRTWRATPKSHLTRSFHRTIFRHHFIVMAPTVLVFGPTGNVGSIVARIAHGHGAKVILAMRDTQKSIPGLSQQEESSGGFERIQADLEQPETVLAAAKKSGATAAFIYLAHHSDDHMKATITALKEGGVKFLVFLSSFTCGPFPDLSKVTPIDRIPYLHATVEMELEEIYGTENFVALRAGAFATNTLWWKDGIDAGEVVLDSPETKMDYITNDDMGIVGGNILVNGPKDGQHIVYLYGPELVAQKDAVAIVLQGIGKEMVWEEKNGTIEASSGVVRVTVGKPRQLGEWFKKAYLNHEEGVGNARKYAGHPSMGLNEWVGKNKGRFSP
jgi:nucleoside-diphosphate-sugar epimerase